MSESSEHGQPSRAQAFTSHEIAAGRRLFAADWQFVAEAGTPGSLPAMKGVELAFAGRSNVGKSSLINALTGRRALARASSTPGRTQQLIFFAGPSELVLVDLPGYGYAAAGKSKAARIAIIAMTTRSSTRVKPILRSGLKSGAFFISAVSI